MPSNSYEAYCYSHDQIRYRESSLVNGVSVSTIREMRFLKSTDNPNIVKLYNIVSPPGKSYFSFLIVVDLTMDYTKLNPICMIMDYVEHDMWGILQLAKESKLAMYVSCVEYYVQLCSNPREVVHVSIAKRTGLST